MSSNETNTSQTEANGYRWEKADTEAFLVAVFGAGFFIGAVMVAYFGCPYCIRYEEETSLLGATQA